MEKQLYSVFGKQVFPKSYDDILMSDYFVITKSGNDYTVYDSFLNKLAVNNIKSIYLKGDYINVLHDGKVENLNQLLQEALPKKYYYITCSQDPNTYYRFSAAYDKKYKRNVIARIRNRWDSSEIQSYALKNLPKRAKLNYIYNEVNAGRKDILNYFKSDPYDIEDFYITAEYKGKKGLYSFDQVTKDFVSDAEIEIENKNLKKIMLKSGQSRFKKSQKI
jgi:archaellum component FlaF (FlaF/FlaG flagellin family)